MQESPTKRLKECGLKAGGAMSGGKSTILVIDDKKSIRSLVEAVLNRDGYCSVSAGDGAEGIHLAVKYKPALILLDWNMQKLGGAAVLKELRSRDETSHIPVVVMTADTAAERLQRFYGVQDHLNKPFDINDLKRVVRYWLNGGPARHGT